MSRTVLEGRVTATRCTGLGGTEPARDDVVDESEAVRVDSLFLTVGDSVHDFPLPMLASFVVHHLHLHFRQQLDKNLGSTASSRNSDTVKIPILSSTSVLRSTASSLSLALVQAAYSGRSAIADALSWVLSFGRTALWYVQQHACLSAWPGRWTLLLALSEVSGWVTSLKSRTFVRNRVRLLGEALVVGGKEVGNDAVG